VNILLDECVPARFARSLVGHAVTTVPKHGWSGIKNGELAEKEFDVFVTVDRKLAAQQDLKKFRIPVILIRARTNRLEPFVRSQPNCSKGYLELSQEN